MKEQVWLPDAADPATREESGRVIHDWDPPNAANVSVTFFVPRLPALRAGRANHVAHIAGVAKPVALRILILKERHARR